MEGDPFAVIEGMAIAAFATGASPGYVYIRGEYPEAAATLGAAIAAARGGRLPRRGHPRLRLVVRDRDPPRRRRLHRGRGDGALRIDRGRPGGAAQQAAVPRHARPPRQADRRQQRRDARQRPADPARRRGGLRRDRHRGLGRPQAVLPFRQRRRGPASTRSRSGRPSASCSTSPAASPAQRRRPVQAILLGGAAGSVRRPRRARRPAHLRGHARHRRRARLGRRPRLRRPRRPRRCAPADRPVLPRRVVRPVRPLPRRHRAPGGAAAPPRQPDVRTARARRSCGCWPRSAARCATPRSADSARPRRRRSRARSATPGWWRCERPRAPFPSTARSATCPAVARTRRGVDVTPAQPLTPDPARTAAPLRERPLRAASPRARPRRDHDRRRRGHRPAGRRRSSRPAAPRASTPRRSATSRT